MCFNFSFDIYFYSELYLYFKFIHFRFHSQYSAIRLFTYNTYSSFHLLFYHIENVLPNGKYTTFFLGYNFLIFFITYFIHFYP